MPWSKESLKPSAERFRSWRTQAAFVGGLLCALAGVSWVAGASPVRTHRSHFEISKPTRVKSDTKSPRSQPILFEIAAKDWGEDRANQFCGELAEMTRATEWGRSEIHCAVEPLASESVRQPRESKQIEQSYRYQVSLKKRGEHDLWVEVTRPDQSASPLDFEKQVWVLKESSTLKQREVIQKILNSLCALDSNERAFREFLLAKGVRESDKVALTDQGIYIDRATRTHLTFDQAYERFQFENRKNRSWLKAMTEIAVVLGGGAVWYLWDKDLNAVDWEYSPDWPGFRKKMSEGIRFDTNDMWLNSPGHPLAGSLYYGFARSNGMTSLEAFLACFAASLVWELAVEYREVLSINDMIFTPIAGAAIGEAMHQLKLFFARSRGTWIHDILLSVFGGASGLDHWVSSHKPPRAASLDEWGFPTDLAHRFDIWAGLTYLSERPAVDLSRGNLQLGLQTELVSIPGYGRAGQQSRLIWDTTLTQLGLDIRLDEAKLQVLDFYIRTAWAGYLHQNLRDVQTAGKDRLSGYSFLIAPASGFQHSVRNLGDRGKDELGVVNVLGSAMELLVFHQGWKFKVQLHAYGDLAAVHSIAAEDFESAGGDLSSAKGVLRLHRYYYAFGVTSQALIQAQHGPLELGLEFLDQRYQSIQGLDRFQEEVIDDFPLQDTRQVLRGSVAVQTPIDRLKAVLELERVIRQSSMDPSSGPQRRARVSETRGTLKVLYQF